MTPAWVILFSSVLLPAFGVADQGDDRNPVAGPLGAVKPAVSADVFQVFLEPLDAAADEASVGPRSGSRRGRAIPDAASPAPPPGASSEPVEVRPLTGETRQKVLLLGEFDLEAALAGARPGREDIQNERGAVYHLPFGMGRRV